MKIICAWCGEDLGEKEPLDDDSVTHSICPGCARAEVEMIDPLENGGAVRTPYGMSSPGFDRDNPPWRGGRTNY